MSQTPLMPKATAVWLVENTSLTFEQIAEFCHLHPLEVKGIADGEVAQGIKGADPITSNQLTAEELDRAAGDPDYRLKMAAPKVKLPEMKSVKAWAALHAGLAPPRPPERDPVADPEPSGAEGRADHPAGRHDQGDDPADPRADALELGEPAADGPVTLGLCSQIDLDFEVQRAAKERPSVEPAESGQTLLPAEVSTAPEPRSEPFADMSRKTSPQEEKIDVDSVFSKLKQLKRTEDEDA
jgi:hypothetical protein